MLAKPPPPMKVLELARVLAGPWLCQTLADLGADVIKVEHPDGDETRKWGPPFVQMRGEKTAAYFCSCNRGKRSFVADFNNPADIKAVQQLALRADVVVENFKVGALKKFGLDATTLRQQKPALVYCSLTGFGQTGPCAHLPGYDFIVQGISGVMDITGEEDGGAQKMGVAFADIFAGLYGASAVLAALAQSRQSGKGAHIDISLLDCMVGVLANQAQNAFAGARPRRLGNRHPNIAPYQTIAAKDAPMIIACGNDGQFAKLCAALAIKTDSRFADNAARLRHRREMITIIESRTKQKPRNHWLELFAAAGVPAAPVNSVEEAFADKQVRHRKMRIRKGGVSALRYPPLFDGIAKTHPLPPPRKGEHTVQIRKELQKTWGKEKPQRRGGFGVE